MTCAVIHAEPSHEHVVDMAMACLHLFVHTTGCSQSKTAKNCKRLVLSGLVWLHPYQAPWQPVTVAVALFGDLKTGPDRTWRH